jgi:putative redox protein
MHTSEVIYTNSLHTTSKHIASGNVYETDAPIDNNGKGQAFSPTDLMSTSLANCMLTVMGIAANNHNYNINDAIAKVTKIMAQNPRRVAEIVVEITMPKNNFDIKAKTVLENTARTCPVSKSLHPDLIQTIIFNW